MTRSRLIRIAVLITAVVHLPALFGGFVWDDKDTVLGDRCPRLPAWRLFVPDDFVRCSGELGYRPIVALSHRLDRALWGERPFGHHLTNLLLHLVVVALLCWLLLDLRLSSRAILVGVLIFAVHPLTVEPVGAISFRTDILTSLFLLTGVLMLRRERGIPALGAVMAAMLSKESALLVPVVLVPILWRRRRWWLASSFSWALLMGAIRIFMVRSPPEADLALPGGSFLGALVDAPALFVRSLALIFGPVSCPDRSAMPAVTGFWEAAPFWVTVALVGIALAMLWRANRLAGLFVASAFLFLLPYLGFYPLNMVLCDRYIYVTLLLIGSAVAACLSETTSSSLRRYAVWLGSVVIFIEASVTLLNHPLWWHHHALFERTAHCAPESKAAAYNYGRLLVTEGKYDEALRYLRTAVALEPRYTKAWLAVGVAHLRAGRPDSALVAFRRTESLAGPFAPVATNCAIALLDLGDTTQARRELKRALTISPGYHPALATLEKLIDVKAGSADSAWIPQ